MVWLHSAVVKRGHTHWPAVPFFPGAAFHSPRITEWLSLETTPGSMFQPLLQQRHPERGAQAHVQIAFGDVQGGDLQPVGSLCQCSIS